MSQSASIRVYLRPFAAILAFPVFPVVYCCLSLRPLRSLRWNTRLEKPASRKKCSTWLPACGIVGHPDRFEIRKGISFDFTSAYHAGSHLAQKIQIFLAARMVVSLFRSRFPVDGVLSAYSWWEVLAGHVAVDACSRILGSRLFRKPVKIRKE